MTSKFLRLFNDIFVISRIIKVSVRVITLISTLIILDITKTSSNNFESVVLDCKLFSRLSAYGGVGIEVSYFCYKNSCIKISAKMDYMY